MIVNRVDAAHGARWHAADAPAARDPAEPRGEAAQMHGDTAGARGRSDDAASRPAREQALSNAAQTVAQLEALIARNPDLADDLEDGLAAARAKLDQAMIDLAMSKLDADGARPGRYADHQADVLGAARALATRYAGDPVALAALDRAVQALCSPDCLREQLDIARVDLGAYRVLQAARGEPADAAVVARKEAEIARLETLAAGADAVPPARDDDAFPGQARPVAGTASIFDTGRAGIDPTASTD